MKSGRLVVLIAALGVAASIGVISVRHAQQQSSVLEACGAVEARDWRTVLQLTEDLKLTGSAMRTASECRCLGLIATQRGDECEAQMDALLADPDHAQWAPGPVLAVHLIQQRRQSGRTAEAAQLAQRASRHFPNDGDLFYLELVTRISVEDEESVLRELRARIDPAAPESTRMRVSLATRQLIRGDPPAALEVLGAGPPRGSRSAVESWYDTRGMALANAGDIAGLKSNYKAWQHAGGQAEELLARYALTISISGLADPDRTPVELLETALERSDGVADERLLEALAIRLILTLIDADQQDRAIAVFDRYQQRFALEGLSRDELERSAEHRRLAAQPAGAAAAKAHFRIPASLAGGTLWIAPEPGRPVDERYTPVPVEQAGVVEVVHRIGTTPLRWVYRNEDATIASGTVISRPGETLEVAVEARRAPTEPMRYVHTRRPADGRRRVVMIVLDCGDWPIVQYLRQRGELPVLDSLYEDGFRAVLDSDPPLTAAALEALVWPSHRGATSFVGLVHQLGIELAGLASVGENPFDALAWILPERLDLFAALGSGEHAAANLLFSHGGIRAGRHSEITGPHGVRRRQPIEKSSRDLDADERTRWPALASIQRERDAVHVRTIAAEFDTAAQIVRAGEVDFLALRVEPLDILTHAYFADTMRSGQDDGQRLLFELYRYIDTRLGETQNLLDADDIFIAMSDHGIRTAMEHSRQALFLANGGGVPHGRAPANPALRGVSAVIAALLDVETLWPRTGVAPWAKRASQTAEAAASPPAS